MSGEESERDFGDLPEWATKIHQEYGEPKLSELRDIFLGPLIGRKSGLRKDDLIEILLDSRALPKNTEPYIRGMLV